TAEPPFLTFAGRDVQKPAEGELDRERLGVLPDAVGQRRLRGRVLETDGAPRKLREVMVAEAVLDRHEKRRAGDLGEALLANIAELLRAVVVVAAMRDVAVAEDDEPLPGRALKAPVVGLVELGDLGGVEPFAGLVDDHGLRIALE